MCEPFQLELYSDRRGKLKHPLRSVHGRIDQVSFSENPPPVLIITGNLDVVRILLLGCYLYRRYNEVLLARAEPALQAEGMPRV